MILYKFQTIDTPRGVPKACKLYVALSEPIKENSVFACSVTELTSKEVLLFSMSYECIHSCRLLHSFIPAVCSAGFVVRGQGVQITSRRPEVSSHSLTGDHS